MSFNFSKCPTQRLEREQLEREIEQKMAAIERMEGEIQRRKEDAGTIDFEDPETARILYVICANILSF